ncbi:MAG: DUF1573 domain-containing protein [Planctomycetales bacterium]|nr:DUF1573 domain-containing protein [Planctomycetales bacterium]
MGERVANLGAGTLGPGLLVALALISGGSTALTAGCRPRATLPPRPPPAPEPPRASPGPLLHDFGRVQPGSRLTARFTLGNSGGSPLRIIGERHECACVVAALPTEPLAPGGTFELSVTLETRGRYGLVRGGVILVTDDPVSRDVAYEMRATVIEGYKVDVSGGLRGPVEAPEHRRARIRLLPGEEEGVRFLGAEPQGAGLRVEVVEGSAGAALPVALEAALPEDAPQGAFEAAVLLRTTSKTRPDEPVRLAGVVQDKVLLGPSRVLLAPGGTRSEATVRLRAREGPAPRIREASTPAPWATVACEETPEGATLRVRLVPEKAPTGATALSEVTATTMEGTRVRILLAFLPPGGAEERLLGDPPPDGEKFLSGAKIPAERK